MKTLIAFEHPDEPGFGERLLAILEKVRPALVKARLATAADHAEALGLKLTDLCDAEKDAHFEQTKYRFVESSRRVRESLPQEVDSEDSHSV